MGRAALARRGVAIFYNGGTPNRGQSDRQFLVIVP